MISIFAFFFITFTLTIPTCIAVGINTMGFDRKDGINACDISSSPQKSLDVSSKDEEKTTPPDIGVLKVIDIPKKDAPLPQSIASSGVYGSKKSIASKKSSVRKLTARKIQITSNGLLISL